jgi:hypothetical protein
VASTDMLGRGLDERTKSRGSIAASSVESVPMKLWAVGLIVFSCAVLACTESQAIERASRHQRQRIEYPPRYTRGSMSQWYKYQDRDGNIRYRQVYPGYSEHFPPPAYLYYGYPKSGDDTGLGF